VNLGPSNSISRCLQARVAVALVPIFGDAAIGGFPGVVLVAGRSSAQVGVLFRSRPDSRRIAEHPALRLVARFDAGGLSWEEGDHRHVQLARIPEARVMRRVPCNPALSGVVPSISCRVIKHDRARPLPWLLPSGRRRGSASRSTPAFGLVVG